MVQTFLNGSGATGLDPVALSMIQWAETQLTNRRAGYDLARAYYTGDQDVKLTDRLKKFLEMQGLEFSDNFCDVVVDALAERLTVLGFAGPDKTLNQWAWDLWQANRMDGGQIITHTEAIMLGDAYVLVDYDNEAQQARLTSQTPEMIVPHYNEETRKLDWLSKKWTTTEVGEDPVTRLNLYYPDRLEKYVSAGGVWKQFRDEGETEWPVEWVDGAGDPLGITMFHFRNKLLSGNYGESEIKDIIPMQDLLNKTLVDLIMLMDSLAFPQRWTLNINHDKSHFQIEPGSTASFKSEEEVDAEVGEWAAGNPQGIIDTIEMLVEHISATSRTPGHLFRMSGDFPSGEALKVSEAGLVHKVKRRQVNFGNVWEDVMLMAAKLEETFGSQTFSDPQLETVWDDPESRNEESHLRGLKSKFELGVPQAQLWREMGYSEEQIAQMMEDQVQERANGTNIGAEILRQFETQGEEGEGEV